MTWLSSGLKQIYGLFVDDGALSLAVCIWLPIVWFVLPHVVTSISARPIVLFLGLAVLLVDSVRRGSTGRGSMPPSGATPSQVTDA